MSSSADRAAALDAGEQVEDPGGRERVAGRRDRRRLQLTGSAGRRGRAQRERPEERRVGTAVTIEGTCNLNLRRTR